MRFGRAISAKRTPVNPPAPTTLIPIGEGSVEIIKQSEAPMHEAEIGKRIRLLDIVYTVRAISVGRAILLERTGNCCATCCKGAVMLVEENSPFFQLACEPVRAQIAKSS